jgi:hypothetical protein
MKIRTLLCLALLMTIPYAGSLIAAHNAHTEDERTVKAPLSWYQAAQSWKMSIEQYMEEADKILDKASDEGAAIEKHFEDLVPIFNPYANLDPQVEEIMKQSYPTKKAYDDHLIEQAEKYPKFTFAR